MIGNETRKEYVYMRGTNINEAVNRPLEAALPKSCGRKFARAIYQLFVTGYNLRTGVKRCGWRDAGCTNLPLLMEVSSPLDSALRSSISF